MVYKINQFIEFKSSQIISEIMKTETFKEKLLKTAVIIAAVFYGLMLMNQLEAQNATTDKEKMKPLLGWAGEWKGEGWSFDKSRQRIEFTVTEKVQVKLDGSAILLEGVGKNKGSEEVGHNALGVLYYNSAKKTYEMNSWLADGNMTLAIAEFNDQGQFVWGFEVPGGRVRYTITLGDNTWNEKGEFVMESGQAFPVMEMNLTRVK